MENMLLVGLEAPVSLVCRKLRAELRWKGIKTKKERQKKRRKKMWYWRYFFLFSIIQRGNPFPPPLQKKG